MSLDAILVEAKEQAENISGQLTQRTRGLLDSIAELSKLNSERPAAPKPDIPLLPQPPTRGADTLDDPLPPTLTPRLAEILQPQAPQPSELHMLHSGMDSLQSTLGAAYMLLAAEAKAEALQAELSEARGDLATTLSSGEELLCAHERCVDDYSELRKIVESARTEAEALAAELSKEGNGGGGAARQICATLLNRLGSSVVLPSSRGGRSGATSTLPISPHISRILSASSATSTLPISPAFFQLLPPSPPSLTSSLSPSLALSLTLSHPLTSTQARPTPSLPPRLTRQRRRVQLLSRCANA